MAARAPADPGQGQPDPPLTEAQEARIVELLDARAKASGPAGAPSSAAPPARPALSDDEYDRLSDREKQSTVRQMVDEHLRDLDRDAREAELRADVDALQQNRRPEGEAAPRRLNWLGKAFGWADPST